MVEHWTGVITQVRLLVTGPDADIDYGMIRIDGNSASAESNAFAVGTIEEDGQLINTLFGGRFMDEFEKKGEEWRISKRTYVLE